MTGAVGPDRKLSVLTAQEQEVVAAYATLLTDIGTQIDPHAEKEWETLWLGFALAKGLSLAQASDYRFYWTHILPLESLVVNW